MSWQPKGEFGWWWFRDLVAPLWEQFVLPRRGEISRYLEIGVAEGMSMLWVLEHLLNDKPEASAIGVDPYYPSRHWRQDEADLAKVRMRKNLDAQDGEPAKEYQHDGRPGSMLVWSKVIVHLEPSDQFLIDACRPNKESLHQQDLIFIDGNHNAPFALTDIVLAWRLLRDGGLMIVDDYERRWRHARPHVREAVNGFMASFETLYDVLYVHERQIAFIKRTRPRGRGQRPPMMVSSAPPPTLEMGVSLHDG